MKANSLEHNGNGSAKGKPVEITDYNIEEVNLAVEELEEVIAPKLAANHNETMVADDREIKLEVEELEQVIAPKLAVNHNETMVADAQ